MKYKKSDLLAIVESVDGAKLSKEQLKVLASLKRGISSTYGILRKEQDLSDTIDLVDLTKYYSYCLWNADSIYNAVDELNLWDKLSEDEISKLVEKVLASIDWSAPIFTGNQDATELICSVVSREVKAMFCEKKG